MTRESPIIAPFGKEQSPQTKLGVIGAGAWGEALASVVVRCGFSPVIWSRSERSFAALHPDISEKAVWEPRLERLLDTVEEAFLAISAQSIASVFGALPQTGSASILISAKGLDQKTGDFLSAILEKTISKERIFILSGPSFSADVLAGKPVALSLAGYSLEAATRLAQKLSHPTFRLYSSDDVLGVQVGGALKNVLAIACGISDARGFGVSARAALMTRGFSELSRVGRFFGARGETLCGLSGLGDLILTGSSSLSRNYRLGYALGQGHPLDQAMLGEGTYEGVFTARAMVTLAEQYDLDIPICGAVFAILSGKSTPDREIEALLGRPLKAEHA